MINTSNVKNIGPNIAGHKGLKRQHGGSPYKPGAKQNKMQFPNSGMDVLKAKSSGST